MIYYVHGSMLRYEIRSMASQLGHGPMPIHLSTLGDPRASFWGLSFHISKHNAQPSALVRSFLGGQNIEVSGSRVVGPRGVARKSCCPQMLSSSDLQGPATVASCSGARASGYPERWVLLLLPLLGALLLRRVPRGDAGRQPHSPHGRRAGVATRGRIAAARPRCRPCPPTRERDAAERRTTVCRGPSSGGALPSTSTTPPRCRRICCAAPEAARARRERSAETRARAPRVRATRFSPDIAWCGGRRAAGGGAR